jgi:rare lipoprotein A
VGSQIAEPTLAASYGKASYYNYHGPTASGKHSGVATAAHRTLPFGTRVKVTNVHNNKSMEVIIQDRGPFARNRIIDVSPLAAESLGFKDEGVAAVALEIVSDPDNRSEADLTK